MAIRILSEFVPQASGQFPVVDVGNVRGAYWSVPSSVERDAIGANNRKVGMLVNLQDTNRSYRLIGGITNSDWQLDGDSARSYATGFVAASSWTITHGLGYNPNVTVINSSGELCLGKLTYQTTSILNIVFSANVTGSGYCS